MASAYCAAKHGVHGLSRTAAMEYGGQGVRVNVVCPGAHRTPMLEGVFARISPEAPDKAEELYRARIPQGRLGEPEETARAIAWLLSADASYVNGGILTVDGGLAAGLG
jgi:NAD(P)-dependent dehydrogenase (short-subunit alcohol dehydrogenase family)